MKIYIAAAFKNERNIILFNDEETSCIVLDGYVKKQTYYGIAMYPFSWWPRNLQQLCRTYKYDKIVPGLFTHVVSNGEELNNLIEDKFYSIFKDVRDA